MVGMGLSPDPKQGNWGGCWSQAALKRGQKVFSPQPQIMPGHTINTLTLSRLKARILSSICLMYQYLGRGRRDWQSESYQKVYSMGFYSINYQSSAYYFCQLPQSPLSQSQSLGFSGSLAYYFFYSPPYAFYQFTGAGGSFFIFFYELLHTIMSLTNTNVLLSSNGFFIISSPNSMSDISVSSILYTNTSHYSVAFFANSFGFYRLRIFFIPFGLTFSESFIVHMCTGSSTCYFTNSPSKAVPNAVLRLLMKYFLDIIDQFL